jgi:hypothetical protein
MRGLQPLPLKVLVKCLGEPKAVVGQTRFVRGITGALLRSWRSRSERKRPEGGDSPSGWGHGSVELTLMSKFGARPVGAQEPRQPAYARFLRFLLHVRALGFANVRIKLEIGAEAPRK